MRFAKNGFKRRTQAACPGRDRLLASGLTGQLRSVPNADKIVQEAIRLGYDAVILPERNARHAAESGKVSVSDAGRSVIVSPAGNESGAGSKGIRIIGAANITDAIRAYLT